ncbi:hypothetical protein ACPB8Q_07865 [Methanocaldococcus indicus]|uniref:hypothetical protein n=1 Tax=Methanocaldococcus indicus TaxID=213231 RepID=UPI003C6D3DE0
MYSLKDYPMVINNFDKDIIYKIQKLDYLSIIKNKINDLKRDYEIEILSELDNSIMIVVAKSWIICFRVDSKIWVEVADYNKFKNFKNITCRELYKYKDEIDYKCSYIDIPILNDRAIKTIEEEILSNFVEYIIGLYIQLSLDIETHLKISEENLNKIIEKIIDITKKLKENDIITSWSYDQDIKELTITGKNKIKITYVFREYGMFVENTRTHTRSLLKHTTIFYDVIIQGFYVALELLL